MKKECEYTRKSLKNYLHGHVYKLQKIRIERHLKSCVVCRSEFESLERAAETRRYLKDLAPAEDVVSRVKEGLASLSGLKKILYRPLWIAGIVLMAAGVYLYLITPRKLDVELESIARTTPSGTAPSATAPSATVDSALPVSAPAVARPLPPAPVSEPDRAAEPLVITITVAQEHEKDAIRRINGIMAEHGRLREKKFSDEVREISGSLIANELLVFFNRIEDAGKASYNRKRLDQVPSAQPIPFVMRLKLAPRAAGKSSPLMPPVQRPALETAVSAPSVSVVAPSPGR